MASKKVSKNRQCAKCAAAEERATTNCEQPIECVFADMSERLMKIQRDLLMPAFIFEAEQVQNTITIFGSARIKPESVTKAELEKLLAKKSTSKEYKEKVAQAKMAVEMSKYYTQAEELAKRLQEWNNTLDIPAAEKFYIMTGGGPGIMEAANKGAYTAGGKTVGATITIPDEQAKNTYVRNGVWINFHYFLMRKFWLLFFAKALVAFPGGTGTFDEFFEVFTLMKTRKTDEHYIPTVLFGRKFWETVVDFEYLVKTDVITRKDLDFFRFADTVDEAFDFITGELERLMNLKKIK